MMSSSGSYCCVGQNAEETTPGTPDTYRKRTSSQQSTTSNIVNLGHLGSSYIENSVNPENGTGHENGTSQEHAAYHEYGNRPGNDTSHGNDISSGNCNDVDPHNDTSLKYEATNTPSTSHNTSASARTQPIETSSSVPQNPPYSRKTKTSLISDAMEYIRFDDGFSYLIFHDSFMFMFYFILH